LTINDRVQAMEYRVMATILETVDNPSVGLAACRMCIERLHCLPQFRIALPLSLGRVSGLFSVKIYCRRQRGSKSWREGV